MIVNLNSVVRRRVRGLSLVEFALVLPILLLLALGVVDFSRAILFNNILTNMSREGANLAARTTETRQFIINALNHTSAPLDMETHGIIFITRVVGVDDGAGGVLPLVNQQVRATRGDWSLASRLWACPSWAGDGSCNLPVGQNRLRVVLPLPLAIGEEVQVVETIYDYGSIENFAMPISPDLYSQTIL